MKRRKALEKLLGEFSLQVENLKIDVTGDTAVVHGMVDDQAEREKVVLALGNVIGIARVDDRLETKKKEPESQMYTVVSGDSLSKIAKKFYGNACEVQRSSSKPTSRCSRTPTRSTRDRSCAFLAGRLKIRRSALYLLAGLALGELFYVGAFEWVARSGRLERWVNRRPDKVQLHLSRTRTPGSRSGSRSQGLDLTVQTPRLQWRLRCDEVSGWIAPAPLLARRLRVESADRDGCRVRASSPRRLAAGGRRARSAAAADAGLSAHRNAARPLPVRPRLELRVSAGERRRRCAASGSSSFACTATSRPRAASRSAAAPRPKSRAAGWRSRREFSSSPGRRSRRGLQGALTFSTARLRLS